MSATASPGDPPRSSAGILTRLADAVRAWRDRRIADPGFQAWAAGFPPTRGLANRRAARLYDLVAGFVYSQTLLACVELDLFRRVARRPLTAARLADETGFPLDGLERLLPAAAALDLMARRRDGRWGLGPLGAALLGAPGVEEMVRHHPMLYRDIADPLALLSGETAETELGRFWSYVGASEVGADQAAAYSRLMAVSQRMVAAETLAVHPMTGIECLMDVGGGEGAFLIAALRATPGLTGRVLDLPPVAERARARIAEAGLSDRAATHASSFVDDPLPEGADAISLVRVLYDHSDETVRRLLAKVHAALPPGGRLIVSEPMSGGARPSRSGDAYFGFYTAAMTSGRPRAPETHARALAQAGFEAVRIHRPRQGFVTRVVSARKPERV